MSGFLRGWLRGRPLETCCSIRQRLRRLSSSPATAARRRCRPGRSCRPSSTDGPGRVGCATAAELEHLHWATTRAPRPAELLVLALDAALPSAELEPGSASSAERSLGVLRAAMPATAPARPLFARPSDHALLARAAAFEAADVARPARMAAEPRRQMSVAPRDGTAATQELQLLCPRLPRDPARAAARGSPSAEATRRIYALGIRPDWWKLERGRGSGRGQRRRHRRPIRFCRGVCCVAGDARRRRWYAAACAYPSPTSRGRSPARSGDRDAGRATGAAGQGAARGSPERRRRE